MQIGQIFKIGNRCEIYLGNDTSLFIGHFWYSILSTRHDDKRAVLLNEIIN